MEVYKIVLTGGPRAGKSESFTNLTNYLNNLGIYNVVTVPETATMMKINGIPIQKRDQKIKLFQDMVYRMQRLKEIVAEDSIELLDKSKDTIILYDRGVLDNRAYLDDDSFEQLLERYNENELVVANNYDYVIGLASSSNIDGMYSKENNIRVENPDEAKEIDERTLDSWKLSDNYTIIDATKTMQEKSNILFIHINNILLDNLYKRFKRVQIKEIPQNLINNYDTKEIKSENFYVTDEDNEKIILEKKEYKGRKTYSYKKVYINRQEENQSYYKNISEEQFNNILNNSVINSTSSSKDIIFIKDKLVWKIKRFQNGINILEIETNCQNRNPNYSQYFNNDYSEIDNYEYYNLIKDRVLTRSITKMEKMC